MTARASNARTRRPTLSRAVEREVWVRGGGRCAICNRYLLDDDTGWVTSIGEVAHNVAVGAQGTRAQRADDAWSAGAKNAPENLVLLCQDHHDVLDASGAEEVFDAARVRDIKRRHETEMRYLTGLKGSGRTAVLRLRAPVQGQQVEISKRQVVDAVIAERRYPDYPWGNNRLGEVIDLAHHNPTTPVGLRSAAEEVAERTRALAAEVRDRQVEHLSVFAYAPTPLLIHLGYVLDDTLQCEVYQRHRRTQSWTWDRSAPMRAFTLQVSEDTVRADEAVLVVNASGTIHVDELPDELQGLPRFVIEVTTGAAEPDVAANPGTLLNFTEVLRNFFAELERRVKPRTLHLVTAAPISLLVTLGRVIDKSLGLRVRVYERRQHDGAVSYTSSLEVPPR